jgi:hypothetical protein
MKKDTKNNKGVAKGLSYSVNNADDLDLDESEIKKKYKFGDKTRMLKANL